MGRLLKPISRVVGGENSFVIATDLQDFLPHGVSLLIVLLFLLRFLSHASSYASPSYFLLFAFFFLSFSHRVSFLITFPSCPFFLIGSYGVTSFSLESKLFDIVNELPMLRLKSSQLCS
jgi:ABC-type uncharacterized transport system permease subunit